MKKSTLILICIISCTLLCACSSSGKSNQSELTPGTTVTATATPTSEPTATPTPSPTPLLAPDSTHKNQYYDKISKDHEIPIVSVYTADRENIVSREEYTECVIDIFNCESQYEISEEHGGIKVRGNSSAFFGDEEQILENTVPYRIKFDKKQTVLGLNNDAECKSWVLLKSDWDLIRNDIAFRMGRAILREGFCSDSTLVYLYINESFKGIYLLCEQCQVNPNRVNITEVAENDISTHVGYYLELDNYANDELRGFHFVQYYANGSVTDLQGEIREFEPVDYSIKSDVYAYAQQTFIGNYMNNLFTLMYEACVNDTFYALDEEGNLIPGTQSDAKSAIGDYVNLDSVVDMYILYEIVHDYDCGEGSFYMCIDFSENSTCRKLTFTSPWDFNWAYYDAADGGYYAAAFSPQSFVDQYGDRSNPWFILLMTQDWFVEMVKERWTEIQTSGLLAQCIAEEAAYIEKYDADLNVIESWATACSYDLLDWINARINWLDSQWLEQS
ncbi:MAG: CotH kinase family protein [Lachnospiraceae bacterium]